jgi:nucleoside-diphosphate-sugar epimerase
LIESIYKNQKTEISYPQHLLDFTYSKTVASGIDYVLLNTLDHFVDLGAGEPLTVQNMASDIVDLFGKDLELLTFGAQRDQDERFCYVDRTSEIFTSGWRPKQTTRDNLRQHCESYRKSMGLNPILKNADIPKA